MTPSKEEPSDQSRNHPIKAGTIRSKEGRGGGGGRLNHVMTRNREEGVGGAAGAGGGGRHIQCMLASSEVRILATELFD